MSEMDDRIEDLEEALWRILKWSEAYPTDIFHEPTKAECARAHEALVSIGTSLDVFSAKAIRHAVKGIGEIARRALAECSGVQVNTPQGHTAHETKPNAQQNEQNDTKNP